MPARKKAEGETTTTASPKKRASSTRSKGEPSPLRRQGTMDKTTAEAEKFLERGAKKRGRPASRSASPKKTAAKRTASSSPKKKKVSPKKIKRQGTMAVTVSEGEKFVEHGESPKKKSPSPKKASPKKSPSPKKAKKEEPKKLKRQGTMVATAAEGEEFLRHEEEEEKEKEKETEKEKEKEKEEENDKAEQPKKRGRKKKEESPTKLKRQGTMAVTATEGQAFVKKSPGRKSPTKGKKN